MLNLIANQSSVAAFNLNVFFEIVDAMMVNRICFLVTIPIPVPVRIARWAVATARRAVQPSFSRTARLLANWSLTAHWSYLAPTVVHKIPDIASRVRWYRRLFPSLLFQGVWFGLCLDAFFVQHYSQRIIPRPQSSHVNRNPWLSSICRWPHLSLVEQRSSIVSKFQRNRIFKLWQNSFSVLLDICLVSIVCS